MPPLLLPMVRELVNEGGDNDTLLSRYLWIYATPLCPGCPLKIVYQARVRPVAPPLLLHRVDQIIFSTSRYGSLFARRTDLTRYRWYINQTNWTHFNRVIRRQRQSVSLGTDTPFDSFLISQWVINNLSFLVLCLFLTFTYLFNFTKLYNESLISFEYCILTLF